MGKIMLDRNRFKDDEAYELYVFLINKHNIMHLNIDRNVILSVEDMINFQEDLKKINEKRGLPWQKQ